MSWVGVKVYQHLLKHSKCSFSYFSLQSRCSFWYFWIHSLYRLGLLELFWHFKLLTLVSYSWHAFIAAIPWYFSEHVRRHAILRSFWDWDLVYAWADDLALVSAVVVWSLHPTKNIQKQAREHKIWILITCFIVFSFEFWKISMSNDVVWSLHDEQRMQR